MRLGFWKAALAVTRGLHRATSAMYSWVYWKWLPLHHASPEHQAALDKWWAERLADMEWDPQ